MYLVFLTWQDYRRDPVTGLARGLVDDRLNFFMMGSTFSLLSHVRRPLWFTLFLVVLVLVMGFVFVRFRFVGSADVKSLGWIFYGLAILDLYMLLSFVCLFVCCSLLYSFLKFFVFKYRKPTPFFGVIFVCFVVNSLFWGSYLL